MLIVKFNSKSLMLLQKITEHDGDWYEMAVYALQCSYLKRTLQSALIGRYVVY